jgi:hypothetical protein
VRTKASARGGEVVKRAKQPEVEWTYLPSKWQSCLVIGGRAYILTVFTRTASRGFPWIVEGGSPVRVSLDDGTCRTLANARRACERAARRFEREKLRKGTKP